MIKNQINKTIRISFHIRGNQDRVNILQLCRKTLIFNEYFTNDKIFDDQINRIILKKRVILYKLSESI